MHLVDFDFTLSGSVQLHNGASREPLNTPHLTTTSKSCLTMWEITCLGRTQKMRHLIASIHPRTPPPLPRSPSA